MQVIWRPGSLIEGQLARQLLQANGIACHLAGEHLAGGIGELPVYGLYALMVDPARAEDAWRLLAEHGLFDGSEAEFEA